jgi:hypothetical protein
LLVGAEPSMRPLCRACLPWQATLLLWVRLPLLASLPHISAVRHAINLQLLLSFGSLPLVYQIKT